VADEKDSLAEESALPLPTDALPGTYRRVQVGKTSRRGTEAVMVPVAAGMSDSQAQEEAAKAHRILTAASEDVTEEAIEGWLHNLREAGSFDYMAQTIRTAFRPLRVKVDGATPLAARAVRRAFGLGIDRHVVDATTDPEVQRDFARFVAVHTVAWATMRIRDEATPEELKDELPAEEFDRRLKAIWSSDDFLADAVARCLTIYISDLGQELLASVNEEQEAIKGQLRDVAERATEHLKTHPPQRPLVGSERPAEFGPPVLTVLSDKNTQAATRGMWASHEWQQPVDGLPYYKDTNGVLVALRPGGAGVVPDADGIARARQSLLSLDDDKVSAFLICIGKWFAETGANVDRLEPTTVYVEDVLAFRGIKKHHKGGYRLEQKEAAKADILFLRDLWVRSSDERWVTNRRGKRERVPVITDDPLLEVGLDSTVDLWGAETPYAFRVRPGDWARHYLGDGGGPHWTTGVLQQIMRYDPRQGVGRLKMRLGIYLAFQWRIRAAYGTWEQTLKLRTLLEGAKIDVPKKDPQRFFPQVRAALEGLRKDGALGVCECLDFPEWHPPADEPPKRWVPKFLDGRWRLLPPDQLRRHLPRSRSGNAVH
jgi:hypothetical protein